MQRLQGPLLAPADRSTPLPLLKAQVGSVLDQAQIQIARQRAALPSAPLAAVLPELLRNAVASLALALGFAAFARRPGIDLTVLEELQAGLRRLKQQSERSSRRDQISEREYLRRLHEDKE